MWRSTKSPCKEKKEKSFTPRKNYYMNLISVIQLEVQIYIGAHSDESQMEIISLKNSRLRGENSQLNMMRISLKRPTFHVSLYELDISKSWTFRIYITQRIFGEYFWISKERGNTVVHWKMHEGKSGLPQCTYCFISDKSLPWQCIRWMNHFQDEERPSAKCISSLG